MKKFVLPAGPGPDGTLVLTGRDFHYLVRVRRLKVGDTFVVLAAEGGEAPATISSIGAESLTIRVGQDDREASGERDCELVLLLGLPKGKKLDQSLRQATELGVAEIWPVLSDYSIPDIDPKDWERKRGRLEAVIQEAVQQSGGAGLPRLYRPLPLERCLEESLERIGDRSGTLGIYFHEKPLAQSGLHEYLQSIPARVLVYVGPEGGISPREIEVLGRHGFVPGFLGRTVLRCETAVVAALAAIKILVLEADAWRV